MKVQNLDPAMECDGMPNNSLKRRPLFVSSTLHLAGPWPAAMYSPRRPTAERWVR